MNKECPHQAKTTVAKIEAIKGPKNLCIEFDTN